MHNYLKSKNAPKYFFALIVLLLMFHIGVPVALAHGPKGHGGTEFTALEAAKKGVELFVRWVASGKLNEPWETDLTNIEVFPRQSGKKGEIVVKFSRGKGEPQSVYIFFTEKGDERGANGTGK